MIKCSFKILHIIRINHHEMNSTWNNIWHILIQKLQCYLSIYFCMYSQRWPSQSEISPERYIDKQKKKSKTELRSAGGLRAPQTCTIHYNKNKRQSPSDQVITSHTNLTICQYLRLHHHLTLRKFVIWMWKFCQKFDI